MNDDEIQAKIAALAGQINKRKQQPHAPGPGVSRHPQNNARGGHWSPYARGARAVPFKNRTLVLAGQLKNGATDTDLNTSKHNAATRGRGTKSGMTTDAFTHKKTAQTEHQHIMSQQTSTDRKFNAAPPRIFDIDGIRFQLNHNSSKLNRILDPSTATLRTPKKHIVAGVTFLRTKHGNLVKVTQPADRPSVRIPKAQCENFTRYGNCSFGPSCRFAHDPSKVAYCKELIRNGICNAGSGCDLSHEKTYHRMPACTHFLRGNCTNSACPYTHVNVSPTSNHVCRPFATLGYCSKGTECDRRHVIECPDFANQGYCSKYEKGCSLPHIQRAGALRKVAKRQAKVGSENDSDVSSGDDEKDEIQAVDETDSDVVMGSDDDSHELSQQQDYVAFV